MSTKLIATFFWRRLDQPGYDSCRLLKLAKGGWRLSGAAVFAESGRACHFQYEVEADARFHTRRAEVAGYMGRRALALKVRAGGKAQWLVNGVRAPQLDGCLDVDLGFTPSTNLLPLRRLALKMGDSAQAPAAYLSFPSLAMKYLPQHYERTGKNTYAYASPTAGYADTLTVSPLGAVLNYPGIFEMVPPR